MITVLISLAVSLGVAVFFRYLDRNNRSLDKVKKFTDKIKDEFDEYFVKQQEAIKNEAIDLDVQKTQAIASVKSLQKFQQDFTDKKNALDKEISAITQMGEKISQYDSALKELTEMSLAVEENLSRIKKEANIIEKLDAKISDQKQLLDVLEKRIPTIEQNFEKKNSEQLSEIGKNLLQEFQSRAEDISSTTTEALKRNEEIVSQITQSFDNVFAIAAEKAETLEVEAFENLKQKSQERVIKYKELSDENISTLKEMIKSNILSTQEQIKAAQSETTSLSQNITRELSLATEKLAQIKSNCE